MNEIDFINTNHPLNLEQEFGSGYIKLTDGSFNEYTGHYQMGSEILDKSHNMIGNLTIDQLCFFNFLSLVLLQLLFIILYFYSTKKCIFGNKKSNLLQKKNFISNSCYCLDLMINEYVLSVCVGAHIH